jgi:hypothetical protein
VEEDDDVVLARRAPGALNGRELVCATGLECVQRAPLGLEVPEATADDSLGLEFACAILGGVELGRTRPTVIGRFV